MSRGRSVVVPAALRAGFAATPGGRGWVRSLPEQVAAACERWTLEVDLPPAAQPWHGAGALVVPVRRADGTPAALKVGWPHVEARDEGLGLAHWAGRGTVRLLATDGAWTHLLERLDAGHDLVALPIDRALDVVAGLYARLHVPAPPALLTLRHDLERWDDDLARGAAVAGGRLPDRLVARALGVLGDLRADPRDGTMLHRDLHFLNVLAGDREPWLAIDPKPVSGDPGYEIAPLLWNRWEEAVATGDPGREARRRLDVVCAATGIEVERALAWTLVREVDNALGALAPGDEDELAVHLTIATAAAAST